MIKYKVLNKGLESPYQNFQYELGVKYTCEDFDRNKNEDCSKGFYATDIEGLLFCYNKNRIIVECEVSGDSVIINQFKQRYVNLVPLRIVEPDEIKSIIHKLDLISKLGYDIEKALFPYEPFSILRQNVNKKEIELLKLWAFVRASLRASTHATVYVSVRDSLHNSLHNSLHTSLHTSLHASLHDSLYDSVRDFVYDSVRAFLHNSIYASVRDSVGAYTSSVFFKIQKWEHIKHKKGENPFKPCIDLWNDGLVPSFDGKIWRLHNNDKILYEMKI